MQPVRMASATARPSTGLTLASKSAMRFACCCATECLARYAGWADAGRAGKVAVCVERVGDGVAIALPPMTMFSACV